MAKQGQHHHDARDQDIARSRNNPRKSEVITTGTYKKPETYQKQAARHQDPGKQAQAAKPIDHTDPRALLPYDADSFARMLDRATRSGSDSNADTGTRGY